LRNVTFHYEITLIYLRKFLLWENGVLQLVSEQVGPSGQVVESCCVEYQLIYCYVSN